MRRYLIATAVALSACSAALADTVGDVLKQIAANNLTLQSAAHDMRADVLDIKATNTLGGPSVEYSPFFTKGYSGVAESELVATSGGPYLVFSNMKTKVACKTGTSEVVVNGVKRNNGFLITFAPYDHPEIAVSSVVELAGSGTETAEMTKDIVNYWYQNNTDLKAPQKYGTLLY